MTNVQQERRRYFRVSDLVGLNYRFLSEGERELALVAQPRSLNNLLAQIEDEIDMNLQALLQANPDLHKLMDLYNQKINLAFGYGLADKDQDAGHSVRACQVNISACGIAFPCADPAALNQSLALDLTLFPNNIRVQLLASVISCERHEEGAAEEAYIIRANFEHLSENDEELLVQHVIKRQALQLKDQREHGDDA